MGEIIILLVWLAVAVLGIRAFGTIVAADPKMQTRYENLLIGGNSFRFVGGLLRSVGILLVVIVPVAAAIAASTEADGSSWVTTLDKEAPFWPILVALCGFIVGVPMYVRGIVQSAYGEALVALADIAVATGASAPSGAMTSWDSRRGLGTFGLTIVGSVAAIVVVLISSVVASHHVGQTLDARRDCEQCQVETTCNHSGRPSKDCIERFHHCVRDKALKRGSAALNENCPKLLDMEIALELETEDDGGLDPLSNAPASGDPAPDDSGDENGPSADPGHRAARDLFAAGVHLQEAAKYAAALDKFDQAQVMVGAPTNLLHIAECEAQLGRLVDASETYWRLVRMPLKKNASSSFVAARQQGLAELQQLNARIPKIVVKVLPANVSGISVSVDGLPMDVLLLGVEQPIDAGPHTITAFAPGFPQKEANIVLKEKEPTLEVTFRLR